MTGRGLALTHHQVSAFPGEQQWAVSTENHTVDSFLINVRRQLDAFNELAALLGLPVFPSDQLATANEFWNQSVNRRRFYETIERANSVTALMRFAHSFTHFTKNPNRLQAAALDCVLVPGSGGLSRPRQALLVGRLAQEAGTTPVIIASGRCAHDDPSAEFMPLEDTEAFRFARYVVERGWPGPHSIAAPNARDTNGNVRDFISVIRGEKMVPRAICLVTDYFHLPRARLSIEVAFEEVFPATRTFFVPAPPPSLDALSPTGGFSAQNGLKLGFSEFFKVLYDVNTLVNAASIRDFIDKRRLLPDESAGLSYFRYQSHLKAEA